MSDEHPKGKGALFINNDREPGTKQPYFRGNIEVTPEQIRRLIEMHKAEMEVKLQVAGWKKTSDKGVKYIFLGTEAYMPQDSSTDGWDEEDEWEEEEEPEWDDAPPRRSKKKTTKKRPARNTRPEPEPEDDFDDDIPF